MFYIIFIGWQYFLKHLFHNSPQYLKNKNALSQIIFLSLVWNVLHCILHLLMLNKIICKMPFYFLSRQTVHTRQLCQTMNQMWSTFGMSVFGWQKCLMHNAAVTLTCDHGGALTAIWNYESARQHSVRSLRTIWWQIGNGEGRARVSMIYHER